MLKEKIISFLRKMPQEKREELLIILLGCMAVVNKWLILKLLKKYRIKV